MSSLSSPPKLRSAQVLLILALFICAGLFTYKYSSIDVVDEAEVPVLTSLADPSSIQFVGRQSCIDCHGEENALWSDSHHDLAMQLANSDTVLGDFENTTFDYHGIPSTFYEKDGRYFVNTDGPDGKLRDYEIKYTFGVDPLQQYLIEFPGGRLQALGIAWDTRPVSEGGQRWFHLYPDEKINHKDELHWTRISQNWNYMCAECHSTNLEKNYDIESNSYKTSWSEIDVSCEACHGPGSIHISWANNKDNDNYNDDPLMGFLKSLGDSSKGKWTFEGDSVIASRSKPFDATAQIETCARCHSRRSTLDNDEVYKKTLYDTHLISRLDENLYHSDGQINDEVYVYGSFLQSKMYRAGVACNDCHELHSLKLHSEGDNLCLRCHADSKYASEQHHFHELGTEGTRCIACHMPAKNYMVVDPRHDHSMRSPRPDLTVSIGTPNACNQCHYEQSPEWAMESIKQWYGKDDFGFHYGEAIHAGRTGAVNAEELLSRIAKDNKQPAIVRATVISQLQNYISPNSFEIIYSELDSKNPMIRIASLNALYFLNTDERYQVASSLLNDPIKSVRIATGRLLAATPRTTLSIKQQKQLDKAVAEYISVHKENGDRAFAHTNLGNLYADLGKHNDAETAYKKAIELERNYLPAFANLADLYRQQKNEEQAESVLRIALDINPEAAALHHALGLSLVRQKNYENALLSLNRAVDIEPDNVRYNYVYAVALNSLGQTEKALDVLESINEKRSGNREIIQTLVSINKETGNLEAALFYAEKLKEISPGDTNIIRLVDQLKKQHIN